MDVEVLVVGAGIAGLACVNRLHEAGRSVAVLEKSGGVGGRCATRRVDGTVVDHGLAFYHGRSDEFRAELERAGPDAIVSDWPANVLGKGTPCQPSSLRRGQWRMAYVNGVTAFPKQLAAGLDVRLNTKLATVAPRLDRWRSVDDKGRAFESLDLVLTMPTPQALSLVDALPDASRELLSIRSLLGDIGFVPALTVIALYPADSPAPDWDMCYPEDSAILQLVSHDSSKRPRQTRTALVLQALPAWSRKHWERPESEWSAAMLEDAVRLAGSWVVEPEVVQTHRWRFARIVSGGDLSSPLMVALPGGRRLGIAGDGFAPGGGVEAAWRSGRELARRLLEDRMT